jgi:hypothetical protein
LFGNPLASIFGSLPNKFKYNDMECPSVLQPQGNVILMNLPFDFKKILTDEMAY